MRKQNRTRAGRFYDSSGRIISGLAIAAMAVAGFAMIPANTFAEGNCTVTYNSNIVGHWSTTKTIPCGTTPGGVSVSGIQGYTFSGNFTSSKGLMSADQVANTVVDKDITYTAIMNGNKYCVTFRHQGAVPSGVSTSQQCYTYEKNKAQPFDNGSRFASQGYSVSWSSQVPLYSGYFIKQPYNFVITGTWSHNGSSSPAKSGGQAASTTVTPSSNNTSNGGQTNSGTPLSSVDNPNGNSSASAKSSSGSSSNNGVSSPKTGVGEFALLDQNESPLAKIIGFGVAIVATGAALFLKRSKMRL